MKVFVLGAGPSGMMAAHAAFQMGLDVVILDKNPDASRRNSGVYYLHADCDLLLEPFPIHQGILGIGKMNEEEVAEAYGRKVYGRPIAKVSILDVLKNPVAIGYDAEQALGRLWKMYADAVERRQINGLQDVLDLQHDGNIVISTIPAGILFPNLKFPSVQTWINTEEIEDKSNFVFYNLNPNVNWYRCSSIKGTFVSEYGYDSGQPGSSATRVTKVLDGDSLPTFQRIFFAGRYGAWKKRILTHNVYYETKDWLANELR